MVLSMSEEEEEDDEKEIYAPSSETRYRRAGFSTFQLGLPTSPRRQPVFQPFLHQNAANHRAN